MSEETTQGLSSVLREQRELHEFLGVIADSGKRGRLPEEIREGLIEELGKLLEARVLQYFEKRLDESGFEGFRCFLESHPDPEALAAKVKQDFPGYEAGLQKVFEHFQSEYGVSES